jgi:hypothetical protein
LKKQEKWGKRYSEKKEKKTNFFFWHLKNKETIKTREKMEKNIQEKKREKKKN